jgi:hypothetical protein
MHQVTLYLSDKSWNDLETEAAMSETHPTDIINRAIQVYTWIESEKRFGYTLMTKSEDGRLANVTFRYHEIEEDE